jgi:ribosomal protein S10
MFILVDIKTKNINSLFFFLKFIFFIIKKNKNVLFLKQSKSKKKIKKFIISKSPHVNKKSKESFEYCIYNIKIILFISDYNRLINTLNQIKLNIFLDIILKLKFFYYNFFNFKKKIVNMNNFILIKKANSKYLKLLDVYGEINLINLHLNSSVG